MNMEANTWSGVSPEQLTQLGKTAAQSAETSGMSLTDAVVRSIGMTKLNEQQVRRVVEAANHEAYNRKFASMDASMRVVELEGGPADPQAVMERLHLAAAPATKVARDFSDYGMEPRTKSGVYRTNFVDVPMTKKAAVQDVRVLQERLKVAHDELVGDVGAKGSHVFTAAARLKDLVKNACADGAYYEDIEQAWGAISPRHTTEVLSTMAAFLPRAPAGVKLASRRITEGHPLLVAFTTFVKHAQEYEIACEAVRKVETELVNIDSFFRSIG